MLVHNPFLRKVKLAKKSETAATYKGIFFKSLWFWLLYALGILAYYYLPVNTVTIPIFGVGVLLAIICPVIVYLIPTTAFVSGSVYSVILGYLIALGTQTYIESYSVYIWIAIGMTALITFVLFILYIKRIIKVNQKVRAIFLTMFIVLAMFSLIIYVSSFYTNVITEIFYGNGILPILVLISMLILAIINLVFEFDYAVRIVSKGACKKYEWVAGYGLFMSIIFIFMYILEVFEKVGRDK